MTTTSVIPHQNFCSVRAAGNALGVSHRKIVDLLVLGELRGKFEPGRHRWLGQTLVRVDSLHAYILRGDHRD